MQFRFYIVSMFNGSVTGTNDEEKAKTFVRSSWVIDSQRAVCLGQDDNMEPCDLPIEELNAAY